MNRQVSTWRRLVGWTLILVVAFASTVAFSSNDTQYYRVTVQNLTSGQPLSPVVAATHAPSIAMFANGELASPELEAIAEDGNQIPMFDLLSGSAQVTQAVDVGMPLTPSGQVVGNFTDAATFEMAASPGDRISLATMLICTNDGFTGLDRARLPANGSVVYWTFAYDAGTEDNTEMSEDIVDPCSGLGPVGLEGDPNGNEDAAVDTDPQMQIGRHRGILGGGDLDPAAHNWQGAIAKVTITAVSPDADRFQAPLSGAAEVPPVHTDASGWAAFKLNEAETDLSFILRVADLENITQAHIHYGDPDVNGPVVAFLYSQDALSSLFSRSQLLSRGTITEADLLGPFEGDLDGFLTALREGKLYVNVHTDANPGGEVRGQIGAVSIGW